MSNPNNNRNVRGPPPPLSPRGMSSLNNGNVQAPPPPLSPRGMSSLNNNNVQAQPYNGNFQAYPGQPNGMPVRINNPNQPVYNAPVPPQGGHQYNMPPRTNNLVVTGNNAPMGGVQPAVPSRTNVSVVPNQQQYQLMNRLNQNPVVASTNPMMVNNPHSSPRSPPQPAGGNFVNNNPRPNSPPVPIPPPKSPNMNFRGAPPSTSQAPVPPPNRQFNNANFVNQPGLNNNSNQGASLRQGSTSSSIRQNGSVSSQKQQVPQPPPPTRSQSNSRQQAQNLPAPPPPIRKASSKNQGNVQINPNTQNSVSGGGLQQRHQYANGSNESINVIGRNASHTGQFPARPINPSGSIHKSASTLKRTLTNIMNRVPSIRRNFSTRERDEQRKKRISRNAGYNVHSLFENSLKEKPIFESQILKKPQNPNFIIALGIIVMMAATSLSIGLIAKFSGGLSEKNIHDISEMDIQGFFFFTLFLLIITLTGAIAYHNKWTSLLLTFSVFIVFGFIIQITIICLFLNVYANPVVQMRNKWHDVLSDAEKQNIQEMYQCCGFLSVTDGGITSSKCFPDSASTTLTKKKSKAFKNTLPNVQLYRRVDTPSTNTTAVPHYKERDPNSFTEDDILDEGCANIIVEAVKTGLLQYIIFESVASLLFIGALYLTIQHIREQIRIEKVYDSTKATFG